MVEQPKYKTSDEVDFVIVGSGAAGGILAKELSTNGFRVVVLEQGPYLTEADYTHNESKILGEDLLTNHPKLQPNTFRKTPQEKAKPQRALVYGRSVGGTSVHFTANFWRFHEIDFVERSKVGAVPGRGLGGLAYQVRGPRAVLHKSGVGDWRFGAGRRQSVRSAALEALSDAAAAGEIFRRDFRTGGAQARLASVSGADGDSFAAARGAKRLRELRLLPGIRLRSGREMQFGLAAAIRMAEKTGRCEIRPDSYVHKIEMDSTRASHRRGFISSQDKNYSSAKAKAVMVCANGAETPRLLLLSANPNQFPNGLANSSGVVGKNLMLNSGAISLGMFEHPLNDYKGFAVSRILHDFYEMDPQKVGILRRRRAGRAVRSHADRIRHERTSAGHAALGQGF